METQISNQTSLDELRKLANLAKSWDQQALSKTLDITKLPSYEACITRTLNFRVKINDGLIFYMTLAGNRYTSGRDEKYVKQHGKRNNGKALEDWNLQEWNWAINDKKQIAYPLRDFEVEVFGTRVPGWMLVRYAMNLAVSYTKNPFHDYKKFDHFWAAKTYDGVPIKVYVKGELIQQGTIEFPQSEKWWLKKKFQKKLQHKEPYVASTDGKDVRGQSLKDAIPDELLDQAKR